MVSKKNEHESIIQSQEKSEDIASNGFDHESSSENRRLQVLPGRNGRPTATPSFQPSFIPTKQPTSQPTSKPNSKPSSQPTSQPSSQPTFKPSTFVTARPSNGIMASNAASNQKLNSGEIAGISLAGGFILLMGVMCFLGSYVTRKLAKNHVAVSTDDIEINVNSGGGVQL